ncbi:MAG TPA: GNAT family N-acetyltransferase [Herpetosiphonaceae bacterium]
MPIRIATEDDLDVMIALADEKRTEYAQYAPTFWRKAADGPSKQREYFCGLLTQPNIIALVSDEDGTIEGFVLGSIIAAPPVYDPGTQVCVIDDFTVAQPESWSTIGRALLEAARQHAAARQANLTVVVCGHLDQAKRAMLRESGFGIASEWYVNPL